MGDDLRGRRIKGMAMEPTIKLGGVGKNTSAVAGNAMDGQAPVPLPALDGAHFAPEMVGNGLPGIEAIAGPRGILVIQAH